VYDCLLKYIPIAFKDYFYYDFLYKENEYGCLLSFIDKNYEEFPTIDMPPRAQNQKIIINKKERKRETIDLHAFLRFLHVIQEVD
jgi:hypothetical protein